MMQVNFFQNPFRRILPMIPLSKSFRVCGLLSVLVLASCSPAQIQRDLVLDQVVKEAKVRCEQAVRDNPRVFQSVRVGSENGNTLVLDYVVRPEAESRVEELHSEYLATLQNDDAHRKDFLRVAEYGIEVRVIYRNLAGELLLDDRIKREDL
jgi:hypothetical protein